MIKDYELINGEYKVTYKDGYIEIIPKEIFEKTYVYLCSELNKATMELLKQLFKIIGLYKIFKLFNIPIKEKWKL